MHDDDGKKMIMGGGTIIGIGWVSNTRVLVVVHDSGIKGGAISPMGLKKSLRAQELALEKQAPDDLIGRERRSQPVLSI